MSAARIASLVTGWALLIASTPSAGQLVLDGSLGPAGEIERVGTEYPITDVHGVFSAGGESRYHSFARFDLANPNFDAVLRSDALPQRVLIRVTESRSRINAAIRSEIPGADVYFFNPFGITFDRGAEIDVSGSFYTGTADALRFPEGPAADLVTGATAVPSLLSVQAPIAFVFTGESPLDVIVEGQGLSVPNGETLSISAGTIEVRALSGDDANFLVPGASLELAAVGGPSELPVDFASIDASQLPEPADGCAAGCLRFDSDSRADASSPLDGSTAAGRIVIRAGRFEMEEAKLVAIERSAGPTGGIIDVAVREDVVLLPGGQDVLGSEIASIGESSAPAPEIRISGERVEIVGSRVASEARSTGAGGDVAIEAGTLRVSNESNRSGGAFVLTNTLSGGAGGDLSVVAERVELVAGGQLVAQTESSGNAGTLVVDATGSVRAEGVDTQGRASGLSVNALESATGSGGDLVLDTGILELVDGAAVSATTFGAGDAGSIRITADQRVTVRGGEHGLSSIAAASSTGTPGTALGASGDLSLAAPRVEILDGGAVSVSTLGTEDAGRLEITAGSLEVGGRDPVFGVGAGLFAQSNLQAPGAGDGGAIAVATTGDVVIRDGGRISVLTRGGNGAEGSAGELSIDAYGSIVVRDGGRVEAQSTGGGNGGRITLAAARGVSVRDGGAISAVATATGDAGDITIDAGPSFELLRGTLTTESRNASGGRVDIMASELVVLQDAGIETSVQDGAGGGGDVTIARPRFVLLDNGRIIARADAGAGGNIRISTDSFLASPDSLLDASSNLGIDGEIVIESPNQELTGKLASLPQDYLNASALLADACLARTETEGSFLVQRAPAGPPPDALFSPDAGRGSECEANGSPP